MIGITELKAQHGAIRAAAQSLLDVAVAARGYRAAATGLLHRLAEATAAYAAADAHGAWPEGEARPEGEAGTPDLLGADWQAYLARWDTRRVATDWPGFVSATHAIMARMLARIDREAAALSGAGQTAH